MGTKSVTTSPQDVSQTTQTTEADKKRRRLTVYLDADTYQQLVKIAHQREGTPEEWAADMLGITIWAAEDDEDESRGQGDD